ncbi:UNVERIFIED_CONTAM: hypothetical protein GTU68_026014 [Idotea baltica]|nr:hypothetical protein [Idotea baltica]
MEGYRSLEEGESVEFEYKDTRKGPEATIVTGVGDANCVGSQRTVYFRKPYHMRFVESRCFNCGEFGTHVAARCRAATQPKRCHYCKSEDHLIAGCPHMVSPNKNSIYILFIVFIYFLLVFIYYSLYSYTLCSYLYTLRIIITSEPKLTNIFSNN